MEQDAMPSSRGSSPGIVPTSPAAPASQADSLPPSHWGKPLHYTQIQIIPDTLKLKWLKQNGKTFKENIEDGGKTIKKDMEWNSITVKKMVTTGRKRS